MTMKPFAHNSGSTSVGDLSMESGTERVIISGSVEITRDKAGLKHARLLKTLIDALVQELESADELPAKVELFDNADGPSDVANPFA